jgi:hypothetical protein
MNDIILDNLVTKFSIMDLLSIFQPSLLHSKTPQKTKKTKQTLYHLSIILLLQVSGIIHPPKVYKAFF